uniref:Uncharacterized protein n=1 Tax=mine drainage metagenome TaxID=410659 RepID=E6PG30_9ZZZZ
MLSMFFINDMFQSTPGRSAGRIMSRAFPSRPSIAVSIHARPLGRANLGRAMDAVQLRHCFNPRPAARPGESDIVERLDALLKVSIHARPLGRANPGERYPSQPLTKVSIHARPLGRANPRHRC